MASTDTVTRALAILAVAYPRFEMAKETPRVYAELLQDIPDEVLVAAVKQHAASSKWFPSVAELRQAAMEIRAQAAGVLTPEQAWVQVREAVQRFGWYGESIDTENGGGWRVPRMLDPLTRQAVDGIGGWRMLCQSENAPADRAHFLRIYGNLLEREQTSAAMLPDVQRTIKNLAEAMTRAQLESGDSEP